jgi:hypothetical protein
MTRKQKILYMIEKLPEDVSYEQVLYKLSILQDIEISLEQAARGEGIDHDELFDRLEAEDAEAKNHLDASRNRSSRSVSRVRRKGGTKDGDRLHKTPQKARRKA